MLDSKGGLDLELFKTVVEQGWTAVTIDEDCGGLGMTAFELCVLAEEIGRHLAPLPTLSMYLVAPAISKVRQQRAKGNLPAAPGQRRDHSYLCFF